MKQYLKLMAHIRNHGVYKADRTGTGCFSIFGAQMRFDLTDGQFPLVTTKRVHLKSIIHELLWFIKGDTNIRYLKENGVSIWDEWVKEDTAEYRDLTLNERWDLYEKDMNAWQISIHERAETNQDLAAYPNLIRLSRIGTDEEQHDLLDQHDLGSWKISEMSLSTDKPKNAIPRKVLIAGDLGPVYGSQWRNWPTAEQKLVDALIELSCLGMGNRWGNSTGNQIAQAALLDIPGIHTNKRAFMTSGLSYPEWLNKVTTKKGHFGDEGGLDQIANLVDQLKNNPDSRRIIVSAWNPAQVDQMALPPCFSAGTLVATPNGYRTIETLQEDEMVISGTGIPRRINKIWVTPYSGTMYSLKVQCTGPAIHCTPNHPFLIKDKGWVEAKDIRIGDLMGIPKTKSFKDHSFDVSINHNKGGKIHKKIDLTVDDYYTLGYFMGNGWASATSNRISFAIPHSKLEEILPRIRKTVKVSKKPGGGENVSTYETRSDTWILLFREFGHKAHGKRVPQWVMESTKEAKESFLEGFFDADGHFPYFGKVAVTTVSASIAYGIQRLLAEFDLNTSVRFQKKKPTHVIEGRTVNQRDLWYMEGHLPLNRSAVVRDEEYLWVPVKGVEEYQKEETVYNLDVDEEHTYTVQNLATHNCHALFQFYSAPMRKYEVVKEIMVRQLDIQFREEMDRVFGDGTTQDWINSKGSDVQQTWAEQWLTQHGVPYRRLSCQLFQRSADVLLGVPFNIASYALLTLMVAQVTNHAPGEFIWTGGDCHLYANHLEQVDLQLSRTPHPLPTMKLNPAITNLFDFKYEDFELVDYISAPAISAPVAV